MAITGSISLKHGSLLGTLHFPDHGWLAADVAQYLGDILAAENRETAILKLLGYTMEISQDWPARKSTHWVEVDLDNRVLTTNSELIRKAVDQIAPSPDDPYTEGVLKRLHQVLDKYDFTVELLG
ncbi:MAG: hypothetical protein V3R94_10665 [Acidobacteriota bacterium]